MCAIFGSKDYNEFLELCELNAHRGSASYSIMGFSNDLNITNLKQHFGEIEISKIKEVFSNSEYVIGHIQDPTDGRSLNRNIHPAHSGSLYLYHNGMVQSQEMSKLDGYRAGIWDTELILNRISNSETFAGALDGITGSFACVLVDAELKTIKLFSNKMCSLYIDYTTMSISSTKKDKFKKMKHNKVYDFKPMETSYSLYETFANPEDIYFIPGET